MNHASLTRPTLRGTALIPVLIVTGMITLVVVLFFSLSTSHYRSSSSHAASYQLNSLRDMAVNGAIAQLRQGTTEANAVWISQPGAVRTYVANSGAPSFVYKLYSARNMVVAAGSLTDASKQNLEDDVPVDWDRKPDVYADLNEPAIDGTGRMTFPIVNPQAMDSLTPTYPGSLTPEGFSYSATLAVSGTSVDGVQLPGSSVSSQRLPMPVQWIYILADGSMGVMDGTTRSFVSFQGQGTASTTNPIVGRIAFWTDDETAKVNINTASEAIYWDTPRCATNQEVAFAKQPPVNNEVQRYGGHPATTCLSSIFFPGERLTPATRATDLKTLYDMTPRVYYKDKSSNLTGGLSTSTNQGAVVLPTPLKRLYASVDEFLLAPDRTEQPIFTSKPLLRDRLNFFLTAESRAPETTASGYPRVSIWPVYYDPAPSKGSRTVFDNLTAFCATLGKVPFHFRRDSAQSNMQDFANVSQSGYVDATNDPMGIGLVSNTNLAVYLVELAKLNSGYSHSFAEKYDRRTTTGNSPIAKPYNTSTGILDCLEYIRQTNMTDTTYSTKGNNTRVNPYISGWASTWIGSDTTGQVAAMDIAYYSPPLNSADTMLKDASDQIMTNGIGREYTLSEFGLVVSVAAEYKADGTQINAPLVSTLNLPKGMKALQIAPIYEGFCPAQGYASIAPQSSMIASQLNTIGLHSASRGDVFPGKANTGKAPTITQAADTDWGGHDLSVSSLGYLTAFKQSYQTSDSTKKSSATWWVPWGGSGGRWMYEDDNSNNESQVGSSNPGQADIDDPSRKLICQYSRGYYIIPSSETQLTLFSNRSTSPLVAQVARCLEVSEGNQRDGDYSGHRFLIEIPANMVIPAPQAPVKTALQVSFGQRYLNAAMNRYQNPEIIDANDVVRTWVPRHGDMRLTYVRMGEGNASRGANTGFTDPNKRLFVPHPDWDPTGPNATAAQKKVQIHSFTLSGGAKEPGATFQRGLVKGVTYADAVQPDFTIDPDATQSRFKLNVPSNYPYSVEPTDTRDWDNGTGIAPDGAYWNKADDIAHKSDGSIPPYFSNRMWDGASPDAVNQTTAPNQLMPSAVMFGSINSAPSTGLQWTTYLFRPDITPGGHLGSKDHSTQGAMAGAPPDDLLLDWFWMPVTQPYAISEPFSTAGKINMNYRIVPFTNIKRATGLHAVLKSEQILAIPTSAGQSYKDYTQAGANGNWRHPIDAATTLVQWEEKFNNGQYFKSPGEICEQFLVPDNSNIPATTSAAALKTQMQTYWDQNRLSGDNTLERPYANIYPRLTTRSNTFRVHFLVQTLTKARSTDATKFDATKDSITGESQGDALVERAIDPNDPALATSNYDYITKAKAGTLSSAKSLDTLYSWRIRHLRRFSR